MKKKKAIRAFFFSFNSANNILPKTRFFTWLSTTFLKSYQAHGFPFFGFFVGYG